MLGSMCMVSVRTKRKVKGSGPREVSQRRPVAEDRTAVHADAAAQMTVAADDGIADDGVAADARVRPDDRAFDDGVFLDLCLLAQHGVRADARARFDHHSIVDEARTFDRGTI